jgi:hypothetical protein
MAHTRLVVQRSGPTVTVNDTVIDPVEQVVIDLEQMGSRIVGMGIKRPIAVVVRSPAGTFTFELEDSRTAAADD